MANGNIHKGHRDRVKKRYINNGLESFDDHQVLELLLFYCVHMKDTNELAHKMINEFGSLSNLFDAHPLDIVKKCSVTENVAVLISMIPSLARRYNLDKYSKDKPILNSTRKIGNFAITLFTGKTVECFYIICLNNQRKLIHVVLVAEGTVDETPIYPRKILDLILKFNVSSIVLVHNHPGGTLNPSVADIESTKRVTSVLEPINIEVLDHIIIANNQYYSFVENKIKFK